MTTSSEMEVALRSSRTHGAVENQPDDRLVGSPTTGAWTAWFGHIINGSTIMVGKMIRHGDPGDPDPAENSQPSPAHGNYPPKFPIPPGPDSTDPKLVARKGAIGPAPNAANNEYLGLEYYKQLVPKCRMLR